MGERVGAILCIEDEPKEIYFLGYGEYVGDELIPDEVGGASTLSKILGLPNPKIVLDDGQVVWGCECWWSPEEDTRHGIEEYIKNGYKVIQTDIRAVRKEWKKT